MLRRFFLSPFNNSFYFFISIFLLSCITECIGFFCFESFVKSIFIALHHFVICYFLTLLLQILPKGLKSAYKTIVFILLSINFIIDIVCVYSFHFTFDQEVPAIILGTNSNEAAEFISSFIPFSLILLICLSFIAFIIFYKLVKNLNYHISLGVQYCLLSFVFLGLISFIVVSNKNFGNVSITKIYTFLNASKPIDLENYKVHPVLKITKKRRPKDIVMIIGESFSKSHSSLYGYEKMTNPKLSSLRSDSLLYVFDNVTSPALNTIPVFQSLMSTYKPEYADSINWYECLTLQELLKESGYFTYWISNQSQKGFHDNVIAKYASLCDKSVFVGNRFAAMGKKDLDEIIIDSIIKYKRHSRNNEYCFYFIHLMGSHPKFENRFSEKFNKFKEKDYLSYIPNQRETLAAYDNSILYNDSVVYEIMDLYKDEEAIVFYFSDHALDIYDSRNDYVGHARYNDEKSVKAGLSIPFFVYMSPLYKEEYMNEKNKFIRNRSMKYRTDDMIYTIMDLIGVQIDGNNYKSVSLLR